MLNLKKTAVAVLAFGSSAVFAGTMGPVCTPGSVTIPCPRTAWDFGAQALYLQSTHTNADYFGSVVSGGGSENYLHVPNPWGWGFMIEGSYHFNTGNDLNLNWYHTDVGANQSFPIGAGQSFVDVWADNWAPGASVSTNVSNKWDAVNLEFGQHVNFGEFVNVRFHEGVEYVHIKNSQTFNGTVVSAPATGGTSIPQSINSYSTYNGFGPRVGADVGYGWNNGFSVYAKSAMSVLVGTNRFTRNSSDPTFATTAGSLVLPALSTSGTISTVNPELEAKLGASYSYAMAMGDLSVDIGWMWVNYFNVIQKSATPSSAGRGYIRSSDFGLQGPYVGLKWVGNVV